MALQRITIDNVHVTFEIKSEGGEEDTYLEEARNEIHVLKSIIQSQAKKLKARK